MIKFIPGILPERIMQINSMTDSARVTNMLSIGPVLTTETPGGLKIIPVKEILFAIGTDENPQKETYRVPLSMVRDLVKRCNEMVDFCESK